MSVCVSFKLAVLIYSTDFGLKIIGSYILSQVPFSGIQSLQISSSKLLTRHFESQIFSLVVVFQFGNY